MAGSNPRYEAEEHFIEDLRAVVDAHGFWNNRLLATCAVGQLRLDDLRFVFSQYHHYAKSYGRCLSTLAASCEDDYLRARLSECVWEESGGADPEKRDAERFRNFLRDGLGIGDLTSIQCEDETRHFVSGCLDFCAKAEPLSAAAFLAFGHERLVERMFASFVPALLRARVPAPQLRYFEQRVDASESRCATLEQVVLALSDGHESRQACLRAVESALGMWMHFFDRLHQRIEQRRVQQVLERIQARQSLADDKPLVWDTAARWVPALADEEARRNISFTVERVPFDAEVLAARVVRIPPGRNDESHRHPEESIVHVLRGRGRITVGGAERELDKGDLSFVPRWAFHQLLNTSREEELVLLVITDQALTAKVFLGNDALQPQRRGSGPELSDKGF